MILALALQQTIRDASFDYSGLPMLQSPVPYEVRSQSVTLDVQRDGTVAVDTLTVYRNLGAMANATLTIPRRRMGMPTGYGAAATPNFPVTAVWDKGRPLTLTPGPSGNGDLTATVPVNAQATHSLHVTYRVSLGRTGLGGDMRITGYGLAGNHPIGLLTMAYRFPSGYVLTLPQPSPSLGWTQSSTGSTIRKRNFSPPNAVSTVQFYTTEVKPIGNGSRR